MRIVEYVIMGDITNIKWSYLQNKYNIRNINTDNNLKNLFISITVSAKN